jgi:hypothetical protein
MKHYTRVFRFGHDLLIPTNIGPNKLGKAPQKLFLLDTGSLVNLISPQAAREVTKVHGDSDMIIEGIIGRASTKSIAPTKPSSSSATSNRKTRT